MKKYKKNYLTLIVVTLLTTFFYSCNDDEIASLHIVNPKAQFTFVVNDENPFIIDFTSNITDRDSWIWDFGDGESSTLAHPTHTYAEAGEYIVTLTAIGEPGSIPAVVERAVIIILYDPVASFSYLASNSDPLEITFNTAASYVKSFAWDFGDGKTSTEKNPTHLYDTAGDYIVTLTATGLDGTTPTIVIQEISAGVVLTKLVGTVIGHQGSWNNNPATYVTAAFDGDLSTFVDGADATGFAGYDFGEAVSVSLVKFAPREGDFFQGRMVGGEIRGSNDPTILTNQAAATYDILYTITAAPAFELNQAVISGSYRFVYYYSADGYCNISELEFYGM